MKKIRGIIAGIIIIATAFGGVIIVHAATNPDIILNPANTSILSSHIAPGEDLLLSVQLQNFGDSGRVDVVLDYLILNVYDEIILEQSKTVAVETTASFIERITLPEYITPGKYIADLHVQYDSQEFPATSTFEFSVKRKFAGFFIDQWLYFGLILLIVVFVVVMVGKYRNKGRYSRLKPQEYPNISKKDRVFYEIITDMIYQMRIHIGDKALELAQLVEGLSLDKNKLRIQKITKDPLEIITALLILFEKELGRKIPLTKKPSEGDICIRINKKYRKVKKFVDKSR